MLVLTRNRNDDLVLIAPGGEEIMIRVCELRSGGRVRLGVCASKEVKILRREIFLSVYGRDPRHVPTQEESKDAS